MKNNIHISIPRNISESLFPKLPFSEVSQLDGVQANLLENVPSHMAEHVVREIREMGCTFFDLVKEDGTSDILYTESTDTQLLRELSEIVTRRAGEAEPPLTMDEHKFLLEAVGFSTDLLTELENEYFGMGPVEDTLTEGIEIYVPRDEGFCGDRDWLDAATTDIGFIADSNTLYDHRVMVYPKAGETIDDLHEKIRREYLELV
jgi:hypothetical protein